MGDLVLTETAGVINCLVSSGYCAMADSSSGTGHGVGWGPGEASEKGRLECGSWLCGAHTCGQALMQVGGGVCATGMSTGAHGVLAAAGVQLVGWAHV